jgi:hypothetical protein
MGAGRVAAQYPGAKSAVLENSTVTLSMEAVAAPKPGAKAAANSPGLLARLFGKK